MKKIDKRSFAIGAAFAVVPLAALVAIGVWTASNANAQNHWGRMQIVHAQRGQSAPVVGLSATEPKTEFPGASDQWSRGFDDSWVAEEKERHHLKPIADNKSVHAIQGSQKEGDSYGNYTAADALLWETETERLVVEGSMIFHNADLLGSTNGTSCDMCHPDAEGTHAETYPKYQVQLGRAALLRDMANWCLTQPCRGTAMSGDDPRMRALEAYMQAQRSGKPMKYGKH